jgi:hypothetical protein
VTGVDAYGETLSTERSATVVAPNNAIQITVNTQSGVTGYNVYGPSAIANQELYSGNIPQPSGALPATTPPFELDSVPTSGATWPRVINRSGCPANGGFFNVPNRPDEANGVTFVLLNNASVCLNLVNTNQSCTTNPGVGSNTPVVMWSPYESTGSCNQATSDGVYPIYSTGAGNIAAAGINTTLGLTGTVYGPSMNLSIQQNAKFSVFGQLIIGSATVQTGNSLNPSVFFGGQCLAGLTNSVRLVQ